MNKIAFGTSVLAIVVVATWAYHINYRTALSLERIADLRERIAVERESYQVLKVEWSVMNAPDWLRYLVVQENDKLGLAPMTPEVFGHVAGLPYPVADDAEALDQLIAQVLAQPFTFGQSRTGEPEIPPESSGLQPTRAPIELTGPAPKPRNGWTE